MGLTKCNNGYEDLESNKGNPAARAYIGTSAAAERCMSAWIMRLNMRGTGGYRCPTFFYRFHVFQVVRRNQAIRALTEKPPHTENTVLFQTYLL